MSQSKSTQLNCFSSPVMIATVIIEIALAMISVWRYKINDTARLIVIFLLALATFQVAEYFVCTGSDGHAEFWSRFGFVAITTLPPMGLHLMHRLAKKPNRKLVLTSYITMASFIGFFLASSLAFIGHQCTGNYVIFQFSNRVTGIYSIYYYGWLMAGIGLGLRWADEIKAKAKSSLKRLEAVKGLIIGYLIFLVPSALAMSVKPSTRRGIPSIMCGFAVLLAIILALYILPRVGQAKSKA